MVLFTEEFIKLQDKKEQSKLFLELKSRIWIDLRQRLKFFKHWYNYFNFNH